MDDWQVEYLTKLNKIEHRLDALEAQIKQMENIRDSLATLSNSYSVLTFRVDLMSVDTTDIKEGIEELRDIPRSRWEKAMTTILTTLISTGIGAIIGLLLAKG